MSLNTVLGNAPNIAEFFKRYSDQREGWEVLWHDNTTPWDRGVHNPALEDALAQKTDILGSAVINNEGAQQKRRKKALVPGCGRGVDVFLLASFGYDAYGLEVSRSAVEACDKMARDVGRDMTARSPEVRVGSYTFLQGDFFNDDWLEAAGLEEGCFDLIYDYTFFCALKPSLRPQWALRHRQLLSPPPRGNLICLEFPVDKDPSTGPPHAAPPAVYMAHLTHPGEQVPYDENGCLMSSPSEEASPNGLERVAHWKPERTHAVGKDDDGNVQDWVSIWRRRDGAGSSNM